MRPKPSARPAAARFHPREWEDFGPLDGRSVLHLQCHNGVETIAFAQRGTARVTGLDFSEAGLAAARRNAEAAGVAVEFVAADVYDGVAALGGRTFDLVYTGRGSLMFLPDLGPGPRSWPRWWPPAAWPT
ncbi:class I SAM-dependent methyltransferase [Streptomyces sp. 8K308]|uniref:class I SAM-dependent methyltransferase n=1 Tax=Streptomyces sp. 8K308 TaxID=2530388 RepID=UPI001A9EAD40|nr:class I SAM-dependent methyltransferase [Streptomyces sp. 8K308]